MIFLTTVTTVKKNKYFFSCFGKSYLTHLATDVMFSGQRFAILAMFINCSTFSMFFSCAW